MILVPPGTIDSCLYIAKNERSCNGEKRYTQNIWINVWEEMKEEIDDGEKRRRILVLVHRL